MTEKTDSATGGRPKLAGPVGRDALERRALALGLIEQTARRQRCRIDHDLAEERFLKSAAAERLGIARGAANRIAESLAEQSTLTGDQLVRLADQLVTTDAGCLNSTDGWVAAAPIEIAPVGETGAAA